MGILKYPLFALCAFMLLFICSCGPVIDIDGGMQPTSTPQIHEITISENSGFDPINHQEVSKDKSAFYYSNNKIIAKQGIAEIGVVEKKLSTITEIPYKDENYIQDGLKVENNFVYVVRIGDENNRQLVLIRVLEMQGNEIKVEYYNVQ